MSCDNKHGPEEDASKTTFQRLREHAQEFIEATPEEHKK